MAGETRTLAAYAAGLRYEDLPKEVVARAKDCIIDTVGAVVFGHDLPWSRIIVRHMQGSGGAGKAFVLGGDGAPIRSESAALANGSLSHAFELDSLRKPGAGVHPGAVLVPAALAAAQERGGSGRDMIVAFVAGCEVLFRIGRATKHTSEKLGFHAPGLTGPYGAAISAGHVAGLDAEQLTNALGIAGSLGGGLLEFSKSGDGGMVKRLHLGRAAEAGVLAARLAGDGFTGPSTILEGKFGFLNVYCDEKDEAALTDGLGTKWETLTLCLKRYSCHITAHTPLLAIETLKAKHGFTPDQVERVVVECSEKASHHDNKAPRDMIIGQYSIPFCVAIALTSDPRDPASFSDATLTDPTVRSLCERVELQVRDGGGSAWATTTTVILKDGRQLTESFDDFPGTPASPLSLEDLEAKFTKLTRRLGAQGSADLFARLTRLEDEKSLDWLSAAPARQDA